MRLKTIISATCCLLCLLTAPACSDRQGDAALERGSTLVMAADGTPEEDVHYGTTRSLVFLTLLKQGDDGELTGNLARSWTSSVDGREWTFHVRSDVKWHDDTPVTARDLAFTFDLLNDPAMPQGYPGEFLAVQVVDDTTLVLQTRGTWTLQSWTYERALPEHLLRDRDTRTYASWDYWKTPVGNGPYRFVRVLPGTMIEMEANDDHYAGRPRVDRVMVKFVGQAGLMEFLAGKVDVLDNVSGTDALRISKDSRLRLYHSYNASLVHAIHWQHEHPIFADPAVRRALTLAIDRRELMAVLHLPESAPIPDALFTERQFHRGELPPPLPFDRAEAERLLRDAGWRDTDGDGVIDRDGQQFRFTLVLPKMWYGVDQAAVYVKDQLRRIGIVAELQPLPVRVAAQRFRAGEFEAYLGFVPMPPHDLERFLGADGFARYRNPRIHELAGEAAGTADADARDRLYREMTEIFRSDLPVTPLFPFTVMSAAHRRVHGLSSPFRTNVTDFIAELWLDDRVAMRRGR
jgi:peptide/nickel transport system substrate-binding protein